MFSSSPLMVKSKFGAEFRRTSIKPSSFETYSSFHSFLEKLHGLQSVPFVVQYADPMNEDLLPINNDRNLEEAFKRSKSLLRILLQRKGESYGEIHGFSSSKSGRSYKNAAKYLRSFGTSEKDENLQRKITIQNDFRLVSAILDDKTVPLTLRRVRLCRTPNKEFGLRIRNGISHYHTANGYETVPSFFISHLEKDGIAFGTGLLAVDDEIVEVNGIEVLGKTLDQVSDMMVANSSNLVITIQPFDQPLSDPKMQLPQQSNNSISRGNHNHSRTSSRTSQANPVDDKTYYNANHQESLDEESDEEITAGMITL